MSNFNENIEEYIENEENLLATEVESPPSTQVDEMESPPSTQVENPLSTEEIILSNNEYYNQVIHKIDIITTYVTIFCCISVVWFCSWIMRSWRTWTSKIGRRL